MSERNLLLKLLKKELVTMDRAISNLKYSLKKAERIDLSKELSADEFELFDSFSSRFLRLYEVLVNTVIRTILIIVNESGDTYLDNLHTSEKLSLITSTKDIDEIRKLRNQVAHEYLDHEWKEIYEKLLKQAPLLLSSCTLSDTYARRLIQKLES